MAGLLDYLSDKYHTENVKEINRRLIELSSLFEISQILNSTLDLKQVLNNILLTVLGDSAAGIGINRILLANSIGIEQFFVVKKMTE